MFATVVDLRRSSPNFGKLVGVKLSAANKRQLCVPHGLVVTSESAELIYRKIDSWYPEYERSLL